MTPVESRLVPSSKHSPQLVGLPGFDTTAEYYLLGIPMSPKVFADTANS